MREINDIIIHCSATDPHWMAGHSVDDKTIEIRRWHVEERGWNDIGYHFIIDRDGSTATGRPIEVAGAHVKGHNANSIGICLIGGRHSKEDQFFSENFTQEQERSLIRTLVYLRGLYPEANISGHNQYAAKACPGFNVPSWVVTRWDIPTKNEAQPVPKGRAKKSQSGTVKAALVTAASGAGSAVTAVTNMEGPAQLMLIGIGGLVIILALYILRERLKAWAEGWT